MKPTSGHGQQASAGKHCERFGGPPSAVGSAVGSGVRPGMAERNVDSSSAAEEPASHLPNRECSTYTTLVWEPAGAPGTPDRSGGLGRNGPGSRKNNSGTQTEEKPQNGKRPRHQLVSHREDACCVCSRGNERRLQLHCPMHVIDRQDRKKNHCGPIKEGEKKNSRFFIPLCVLCGILEHWQNTSEITYPRTGSWTRHIDSARSERKKKSEELTNQSAARHKISS